MTDLYGVAASVVASSAAGAGAIAAIPAALGVAGFGAGGVVAGTLSPPTSHHCIPSSFLSVPVTHLSL